MRLGLIVVLATIAMAALIARDCSARKDGAATKVETSGDVGAGDESQSTEFSLSAKDDEGFDLPEREEIRQKRKLAPGMKVFVIGFKDARVDSMEHRRRNQARFTECGDKIYRTGLVRIESAYRGRRF